MGEEKEASYYKGIEQQILGDEEFIEKVEKATNRIERPIRKPSIDTLIKEIEKLTGVMRRDIIAHTRSIQAAFARGLLVEAWREADGRISDLQAAL